MALNARSESALAATSKFLGASFKGFDHRSDAQETVQQWAEEDLSDKIWSSSRVILEAMEAVHRAFPPEDHRLPEKIMTAYRSVAGVSVTAHDSLSLYLSLM